ncbi:MAG: BMP family ABC transporter substrate-binding protein [Cellulosilyticaceae bacterium]
MKSIHKLFAILLILILIATGCSTTTIIDDLATNQGSSVPEATTTVTTQPTLAPQDLKVGVLHLTDPAEGSGYTYSHELGIRGMQDNLGLQDEQIIRKLNVNDQDPDAIAKALQECVDEGCQIIFSTSYGYMEQTAAFAQKYPHVYFSHATGSMSNGTNFNNYFGRIYQARYLSGIAAGLKTKTNKLGYVAAMGTDNSEVTGGINAFALGVASVNPDATVYVKVTNSWFDPQKEEAGTKALLDMGCDVMAQHCDTPYPLTLAAERGKWGIGYNSDMQKEVPDACLLSVMWNWSAYYTSAVQSILEGTWNGSNYYGGISDGIVQISSLSDFNEPNAQTLIDEATSKMLTGQFNVFDGMLETNTGEIIGISGGTLSDETIQTGIHWYYKNVRLIE